MAAKRRRVVEEALGPTPERARKDERYEGHPLDVLHAEGIISEWQKQALEEFARAYRNFISGMRLSPKGTLDPGGNGGRINEAQMERETAAYREAAKRLEHLSRNIFVVVRNVACYDFYPFGADRVRLVRGANELCRLWGIGMRRAA